MGLLTEILDEKQNEKKNAPKIAPPVISESRKASMQKIGSAILELKSQFGIGSGPEYAAARSKCLHAYEHGSDSEFETASANFLAVAKNLAAEISESRNLRNLERENEIQEKIKTANNRGANESSERNESNEPTTLADLLAARFCDRPGPANPEQKRACGSPAFWLSVYDVQAIKSGRMVAQASPGHAGDESGARSQASPLKCRECEPPPAKSLVGLLLYAYLPGGPAANMAPAWDEPELLAELLEQSREAGSRKETSGDGGHGELGRQLEQLTEQITCADGRILFTRPGWNDLRSPWYADSVTRATIAYGAEDGWREHLEITNRLAGKLAGTSK
jgi:hypothetical protein